MKVELINITNNPVETIYKAYRICYSKGGFNEIKIPSEEKMIEFIKPLMAENHTSPLEHVSFTFNIEGISRACLAQITRHRTGKFNCVSGDTVLRRGQDGKKKTTIQELYEMPQQYRDSSLIRCFDRNTNELTKTKVLNVWKTGVKEVYKVTAKNGYSVKTTLDHRFLTPDGWKELKDIKVGDIVYTNGIEAYKNKEWLHNKYHIENLSQEEIGLLCGVSKHTIRAWIRKFELQKDTGSWSKGKEPVNKGKTKDNYPPLLVTSKKLKGNTHRANHRNLKDITDVKLMEKFHRARREKINIDYCEICGVIESDRYEVHHIDKNRNNCNQDNLLKLCTKCHKIQHKGDSVMTIQEMKIESIEYIGEEETYDIEVEHQDHNFVGSGFILHNCQSQRYVDGSNFDFVIPDLSYIEDNTKKYVLEEHYKNIFKTLSFQYEQLLMQGIKKEDARAILPQATTCNMLVTFDLNNFRKMCNQRLCNHAQKEIREMSRLMMNLVKEHIPFADYKVMNCGITCNQCMN